MAGRRICDAIEKALHNSAVFDAGESDGGWQKKSQLIFDCEILLSY